MKITPPNITPGDWHIGKRAGAEHGAIYGAKGEEIAIPLGFFMDDAEAKANAKAIAATPDALAALARLLRAYENKHGVTISGNTELALAVFAARAALLKAGYTLEE